MKFLIRLLVLSLSLGGLFFPFKSFSQKKTDPSKELRRRAFMGISMENLTDDLKKMTNYTGKYGAYINRVVPGSTAESIGLKKGDIIISINSIPVNSGAEAVSIVGRSRGGDKFEYEIFRGGNVLKGNSQFKSYPVESFDDLTVDYTQASTNTGLQRIILTKKKNAGKQPLIIFIGGIGCYALDFPLDTSVSEVQVINLLARNGFSAARIDKPGMGDNAGQSSKACNEIGFHEEVTGYVQCINALKKRADVDSNRVFIIGHSMGGVMAPLIARQTAIKGIIAYGTIGSNFLEYLIKTRRTIAQAYNWTADETDAYIKDVCECSTWYFADKLSTEEATKKKKDCAEYLSVFDFRARVYNDELYAINIPAEWMKFKGKALLMWGAADFVAAEDDHRIIVDALNRERAGSAEFMKVPAASHGMQTAGDFPTARTSPGPYNKQCGDAMLTWLNKNK